MNDKNPLEVLGALPIEAWDYPRIMLGVPMERTVSYASQTFYSFWQIAQQGVPIIRMPYGRIDVARNKFAVELLRSDFTHLLMLDLDHAHPKDIVQKLARWTLMEPFAKVVGGLNFRRSAPFDPCCGFWGDDDKYYPPAQWEEGLIRVDIVGTGSILIAREVFELIEPPWFYFDYSKVWENKWIGEDITFARKCQEHDIDEFVDTTVTSPHMQAAFITEETFKKHMEVQDVGTVRYDDFMEQTRQQTPE